MGQRRSTCSSPQKFKQPTLLGYFSSPPPPSPSNLSLKSPSPGPSKRKRTRKIATPSPSYSDQVQDTDSDVDAIRFEPEEVEIGDEDHSPRRSKKRKSLVGAHAIPKCTISDESAEETIGVPRYRKGKKKVIFDSDEDDARPRKRKLIKGIRPPTPEEDDDILDARNLLESRLRSRGKVTAYQKNLEKLRMLKGKKRGEIVLEFSSEDEQSESSVTVPFKGAKRHHSGDSDASEDEADNNMEEDESFIVDDDPHGVPATRLPLEFSMSTHQDLTHQFKIICQLFVHVAVQPLVDRRPFFERALKEEEYFSMPLHVTRRKLSGMRDSLVASSVWRSDFKKVLEGYPGFTLTRLDYTIPQCDACHLGGRLSTLLARLSGKRYDKYDFEDVSDDESGECSEEVDDDDSDMDEERHVRAEFHLGRFCAARTRVYHQFSHWEYSLYKSLQRKILEAQDETRWFVKVAYAGGVKPPRDLQDADKVMEWLDQRGIINMEWQRVRQMMDSARSLERDDVDDESTTFFS